MDDPYSSSAGDPEVDAFVGRLGQIAFVVAGGLVMAFLGAGLGSWLGLDFG